MNNDNITDLEKEKALRRATAAEKAVKNWQRFGGIIAGVGAAIAFIGGAYVLGKNGGYSKGKSEGYKNGLTASNNPEAMGVFEEGRKQGYETGYQKGQLQGYYEAGRVDAQWYK